MLSYLHSDIMEAKLTLKIIIEAYYKQMSTSGPPSLSFSLPDSWIIVIVWNDCFTYLLLTKKIFCIRP